MSRLFDHVNCENCWYDSLLSHTSPSPRADCFRLNGFPAMTKWHAQACVLLVWRRYMIPADKTRGASCWAQSVSHSIRPSSEQLLPDGSTPAVIILFALNRASTRKLAHQNISLFMSHLSCSQKPGSHWGQLQRLGLGFLKRVTFIQYCTTSYIILSRAWMMGVKKQYFFLLKTQACHKTALIAAVE